MNILNRKNELLFDITITSLALGALIITLYPLYFVMIASVSSPEKILAGDVWLWPSQIDFSAYRYIFDDQRIWTGYRNTIFYTGFGTLLGVAATLLSGYALSRKDLIGRGWIMKFMVFTMFFNGGLIPTYLLVKNLQLLDTPFVLIIMSSIWVFNIIIARTFFEHTVPVELMEAAFMDGCGNLRFFISIVLPISSSIIAVIALFYAVGHWNSYFNALIYVNRKELFPLQLMLREILVQGQVLVTSMDSSEIEDMVERQRVAEIVKYSVVVVSSLPLICAYPFVQKYFVKGVLIGSVKG